LKIKVKENIEFLKKELYEVIAIDSRAIEFYLIQLDNKEFIWIESQYFDKRTIECDNLQLEKLSEYSHLKLPKFLAKENRKLGTNKFWSLHSSEFCNYISLNKALKKEGYELNESIIKVIINEEIQYQIIEQHINQVGKTLLLLGDGYFPSIVSIKRTTKGNPKEHIKQDFRLDFQQMRNDQTVIESQISNLDETLDELYDWSYNYVKGFSKYSGFFEDDFWNNQILDMLKISKMNLLVYADNWNPKITRYFLPQADGTEINLLQMENENSKTTLRIQNVIH